MDDGRKLAINLSVARRAEEYAQRDTKGFTYRGTNAGFFDPNRAFSPQALVGQANAQRGVYLEARYAHDIIASVMDARKNVVANLEYEIVPRSDNPTIDEVFACEAVRIMWDAMPYCNVNTFLADVYDDMHSFGFSLREIYVPEEGPNAYVPQFLKVAPYQVDWFDLDDTRTHLKAVHLVTDTDVRTIPGEKFLWFGRQAFPGNFWGVSDIRKLVALFTAQKEDLMNYLQLRRMQAGIFYFDEKEEGATTEDWEIAANYLKQYYGGLVSPLIASKGMKPDFLNAQQPGIDNYDKMLGYFDTKIKQALDSTLTTLGLSGVGSLALGQEFAVDDAVKFENHIRSFLRLVNGDTLPESGMLQVMTRLAGCDPRHAPKFRLVEAVADQKNENIPVVLDMLKSEIITREEFGDENMRRVLEDLGYDGDNFIDETTASASTLAERSYLQARYDHIDFSPPEGVQAAAARGLELRREFGRGGTEVGVARARDLSNGKNMTPDTIKRMNSYFARHEVDKEGEGFSPGEEGYPSAGRIAWLLWGGDAGQRWASKITRQMEVADKSEMQDIVKTKPSERIEGSKKNPEGTASGQRGGIEISEEVETALRNKLNDWKEKHGDRPVQPTMGMLKSAYRRGAGAFSSSHRRGQNRHSWSMARVNTFLDMLRNPDSVKAGYKKTDRDILTDEQQKKLGV